MNNAIIFIRNEEEEQLSKAPYLGGNLLLHLVKEIRKLKDLHDIYIVGTDSEVPGCITKKDITEVIGEIGKEGKTLLVSPLFPELNGDDFEKLLSRATKGSVLVCDNEVLEAVAICNEYLEDFAELDYEPVEIKHFADGETLVELGESVRGKRCYIIQSTCKPVNDTLMEVLICLDAMRRSSAAEVTCIIPYFGYARQDRKASPRQPITAKLVASMLEEAGANRVVTFDLHAAQIQGFVHCPVDDLTTVPMMGHYFRRKNFNPDDVVVVSPDHGGVKRARNLAEILGTQLAIIDKRRPRPNVVEACTVIGDVRDKDVIIVDDICDTGCSLIASSNILKENGAKDIYVCITHGLFSNNAALRIQDSPIKEIVCTNTIIPPAEELSQTDKITTLSVGWMLSKLILAVSCHTPVSEVYALYE